MAATRQTSGEITIGVLGPDQHEEVSHLAQLDSSRVPEGALLGATVDGRLLAAISLASGETIADPFVRTDWLRELLRERAAQLNGGDTPRGFGPLRLFAFAGRQVGAEGERC
jgi:hypothetical protein